MKRDHSKSSLTDEQEALLDLVLAEEGLDQDRTLPIPLRRDSGPVPLTYAQSRIWFLEQMNPGDSTFIIPTAVRLPFSINESLLTEAFHTIWQRHTVLKMTVYEESGSVFQKIGDFAPPPLPLIDLSSLANTEARERKVAETVNAASKHPFNLGADPLIRLALIRTQPDEHVVLLTTHHLVSDGWSIQILLYELMQAYMQLVQGQVISLPSLPIQYTDYAAWQPEWLASDEVARQFTYWQSQLQGPLPHTELPADFARPSVQTFRGEQLRLTLPPSLHQRLLALGQQTGATLYMTLMAAFKVLLKRHIGQDEIIIGSPVAGRQRPELEPLVGLFLNTLVLRTELGGMLTFLEVLARVRQVCIDAFANQDVPFEMLLAELLPSRDISRTPFFQIFFNMLEFDQAMPDDFGTEFISPSDMNSKFDMTLYLEESQHGIDLTLVYNRDLFTKARMEDFLQQYQLLLAQVVRDPDLSISQYTLLTDAARAGLPDPTAPLSDRWEGPVYARLDAWAERRPQKTAVSDPNSQWTYQQVAIASSRLAQFLYAAGVQTGDVVAIYGYRCAALVPTIMGVLKAGAAVLILDPTYPEARLEQYLALAKPTGWISFTSALPPHAVQTAALKTSGNCQLQLPLPPRAFLSQLKELPNQGPPISLGPDDWACLMFTSGSTGEPKAIIGQHRSLTHFYPWMAQQFQLAETDRFSMLSGLAHDPLQRDIFTAIWVGAEICVPDPDLLWQPGYLAQWFQTSGITVTHLIPSMIHVLMTAGVPESNSRLRLALFVGESLKRYMAEQVKRAFPAVTIVNLYGAGETQRAVSYHVLSEQHPNQPPPTQEIPIGKGMPGSQLLVLTSEQKLAGVGDLGELYMRSPHLALGYLQDEEKSTDHFLQNPWSSTPGDRLYRSGDYGRYLPNGQVVFAGRQDSQVNIHGYRVELSEIEAVLTANPNINAAVVTAFTKSEAIIQLVAYVVRSKGKKDLNPRQVQAIVKAKLPLPMVPTIIIFLNDIPITPNGKIDYSALPDPDLGDHAHPLPAVPRDRVEKTLLSIWQALLPADSIGIHDDFFASGGHSILAVQIFSRIRDEFGIDLNIGLLFRYPTIAELAQIIRIVTGTAPVSTTSEEMDPKNQVIQVRGGQPGQPYFFCVHGAGGHVMFMQKWQAYFDHWSIYGIESPGVDGISWPQGTLESVAADYVVALQAIQSHGPFLLGGYSGGGAVAYEMAQQLQRQGQEVSLLVLIGTYHPAVRSRPHAWPARWNRLSREPVQIFRDFWQRTVAVPLTMAYIMNRYVKRDKRVPFEMREPILEYFLIKAKQQYRPKPYNGRVLLVSPQETLPVFDHVGEQLGWDGLLTNCHLAEVPGNHFTLVQEPNLYYLAQTIEDTWARLHENSQPMPSETDGT